MQVELYEGRSVHANIGFYREESLLLEPPSTLLSVRDRHYNARWRKSTTNFTLSNEKSKFTPLPSQGSNRRIFL